jgi:Putative DNA-binding domain
MTQLPALLEQQTAMLEALLQRGRPHALKPHLHVNGSDHKRLVERGIEVYRANAAASAERSLSGTFPVLAQLIGRESFEPLARHFWQQHPPQRGDLAQWGTALPEFLAAAAQLADEPFLADVARVEWALHTAATAQDAVLEAASFALLATGDAPHTLALSAGCVLLHSAYPVATLVNAHLSGVPSLEVAAQQLASGKREIALVWRHGLKPRVRSLDAGEAALVHGLLHSAPLDAALQAACDADVQFDFNAWLGQAVQSGLVIGAIAIEPTQTGNLKH